MLFISWEFVAFLTVVLAGLRLMPTRESRQCLLLVASGVFYGAHTPWHLLILATPSLIDFACAARIEDTEDQQTRKRWLIPGLYGWAREKKSAPGRSDGLKAGAIFANVIVDRRVRRISPRSSGDRAALS